MSSCLSYWFPKIVAAGVPVPRTAIVFMSEEEQRAVWEVFDGKPMGEMAAPFFDRLSTEANEIGFPCFLRTGHTSAKHDWKRTCYVHEPEELRQHVLNIIEYGEMSSLMGLPHDVWAVRELLPTIPLDVCHHYGDMPVCQEFRMFVEDGKIQCWHPYWPLEALEKGGALAPKYTYEGLARIAILDFALMKRLAEDAGKAVGGYWSVDVLRTKRGLFVTDMAEGDRSWHWEPCSINAARVKAVEMARK